MEHIDVLERLKVKGVEVRRPQELEGLCGLIIPGGESTTMLRLLEEMELRVPLLRQAQAGLAIWGTCAGMILLANHATDLPFAPLGLMDIQVRRNAFGRQVDSFEVDLPIPALGGPPFPGIFIRAPFVEAVGPQVQVLCQLPDGRIVAAQQGKLLVTAFHPELSRDVRLHAYFLKLLS